MTEEETIKYLQAEIDRLSKDLQRYAQELTLVKQKMNSITGAASSETLQHAAVQKPVQARQHWHLENFIGLQLIHVVGIIILVIGLSIGVKYAIDKNLISEVARVGLAYAAGFILYALSYRLKKKYTGFSAILLSGAMATLYFTTYAAFVYYGLYSFPLAFALMILFTCYTVYQALQYNRQEIALLGLVGAYAIPFLISKNTGRADLFFLYISLINIGVVFLHIRKQWKGVGRVAQLITWVLFIGWASLRYTVAMQSLGFFFLSFFYLLFYVPLLVQKAKRQKKFTTDDAHQMVINHIALYIALLLVFANSLDNDKTIALVTLSSSVFIGLQAFSLFYLWKDELYSQKLFSQFSIILFVLFIAFEWDGITVTLLWLLTAVIIFCWGVWRKSSLARMTSIILIGTTLLKLLLLDSLRFTPIQKIISYVVLGVLLLIVSFYYQKFKEQLFKSS